MIRIGINGFGRIGSLVFRAAMLSDDVEVVAVNAPRHPASQVAYAAKYDTVHGRFGQSLAADDEKGILTAGNSDVRILSDEKYRDASLIPWGDLGVDYVMECTGQYRARDKAQLHLDSGARAVVISGPTRLDVPMFVCGVNLDAYEPDMDIVSNASCTTNCVAPLAKVIDDSFGIAEGFMTTIHATTASQSPVDGFPKKNWRLGRSVFGNIVPTTTGAADAVGRVVPSLKGKMTGISIRVPSADVSLADLTVRLEKPASYEEICAAVKQASEGPLKGVLDYTEDEVVSQDFRSDAHTSIFDAHAGKALNDQFVKLLAWYDNEWGFSNKMLDLTRHIDSVRNA